MRDLSEVYTPRWAPMVTGRFEARALDPETGHPEPQHFVVDCSKCGAHYEGDCDSGFVRQRIGNFAIQHTHRDPLSPLPGATK